MHELAGAVIAESFERIHRSNLVGMGVAPFVFEQGTSWESLGLKGDETITIQGLSGELKPRQRMVEASSDTNARSAGRISGRVRAKKAWAIICGSPWLFL